MLPEVVLFCVRNSVVKALVVAENIGGGTLPFIFTTAMLWLPEDAVVGINKEVITKSTGAVNQYPRVLPGKVVVCAGIGKFCGGRWRGQRRVGWRLRLWHRRLGFGRGNRIFHSSQRLINLGW